jgi:hypothetical protein
MNEPVALRDRLHAAARRAGIGPDEPLFAVIETLGEAATAARLLTPEAEADLVKRIEASSRRAVIQGMEGVAATTNRKTALIGAAVLVLAAFLSAGVGYWAGTSRPVPSILGPLERATADVLATNNLDAAIRACRAGRVWRDATGRSACSAPLWLEAAPVPRQ